MTHPSQSSSGFTVIEAVVYAALALMLIGLGVLGIGTLQKNTFKSNQLARTRGDANEAMSLMARDLRNLGLKRILYQGAAGTLVDTQLTQVDYAPADSSSFMHLEGAKYDTLTFLKPVLNAQDKPTGIDTLTYAVNPATQSLTRKRNQTAAVSLCERVEGLQFQYRISGSLTLMVDQNPPQIGQWSQNPLATLSTSGAILLASRSTAGTSTFWVSGTALNLSALHRYALDLKCQGNAALLANVDSLVAMICNAAGTPLATQTFLPDLNVQTLRIEFGGLNASNCRVGMRMHLKGAGQLQIHALQFWDIEQGDGPWVNQPTLAQKKAAKSIRVLLLTRSGGDVFGNRSDTLKLANAVYAFNDKAARVVLDEVVSIRNNGSR